jgi:hypothetical protein
VARRQIDQLGTPAGEKGVEEDASLATDPFRLAVGLHPLRSAGH